MSGWSLKRRKKQNKTSSVDPLPSVNNTFKTVSENYDVIIDNPLSKSECQSGTIGETLAVERPQPEWIRNTTYRDVNECVVCQSRSVSTSNFQKNLFNTVWSGTSYIHLKWSRREWLRMSTIRSKRSKRSGGTLLVGSVVYLPNSAIKCKSAITACMPIYVPGKATYYTTMSALWCTTKLWRSALVLACKTLCWKAISNVARYRKIEFPPTKLMIFYADRISITDWRIYDRDSKIAISVLWFSYFAK